MGETACSGDHRYVTSSAETLRKECRDCGSVLIDLDAAEDGLGAVTTPGLFKPARPTIFSVLREEQIEAATAERTGPRFGFGDPSRLGGRHQRHAAR